MVEATPTPEVSPGGHSTFLFRAWPGAQRVAKAIRANWVGNDAARGGGYWLLDVDVGVGVVVRCVWLIAWARGGGGAAQLCCRGGLSRQTLSGLGLAAERLVRFLLFSTDFKLA